MEQLCIQQQLEKNGIPFDPGMSESALHRAEEAFGFRFPREIRAFFACGVPVGADFFDYRDLSKENRQRFQRFQTYIESAFQFDLEHNAAELLALLGEKLGHKEPSAIFTAAVHRYREESVRLIPFYAHRCFFDGMDGMPIVSFWQATDVILYGDSFKNYLEAEFLGKEVTFTDIPQRMAKTGIWSFLATP